MDKSIEIMRVLRVPPLGKLVVEVGGKTYTQWSELPEGRARQLVLTAIGELVAFEGGYQKLVDAGVAPPIAPPAPVGRTEEPLTPAQAAFLESLRGTDKPAPDDPELLVRQLAAQEAPPTAAPSPVPAPAPVAPPAAVPPPPPPPTPPPTAEDPIAQLNQILQKHVATAPELAGQLILLEERGGGVQLNVNGTYYAKPSEVPNPLIRLLVKTARQEWAEKR